MTLVWAMETRKCGSSSQSSWGLAERSGLPLHLSSRQDPGTSYPNRRQFSHKRTIIGSPADPPQEGVLVEVVSASQRLVPVIAWHKKWALQEHGRSIHLLACRSCPLLTKLSTVRPQIDIQRARFSQSVPACPNRIRMPPQRRKDTILEHPVVTLQLLETSVCTP